ncbi:MAG: translesion DNA synthesis-associated protein ImuA [Lysobacterales bacterium]
MGFHSDPAATPLGDHPLLWRGRQAPGRTGALGTGLARLDAALPGHGWPQGAITEIIHATAGYGELSLLLPALAGLGQEGRWVTMVDPPWIPCPAALHGRGLPLEKLLLVKTKNRRESLWACEQVVRGLPGGALLAWPQQPSFGELRRLQLAAADTRHSVFLFRDESAAAAPSPAALRLRLAPGDDELQLSVLKCRGQRPPTDIRIRHSRIQNLNIPAA